MRLHEITSNQLQNIGEHNSSSHEFVEYDLSSGPMSNCVMRWSTVVQSFSVLLRMLSQVQSEVSLEGPVDIPVQTIRKYIYIYIYVATFFYTRTCMATKPKSTSRWRIVRGQ